MGHDLLRESSPVTMAFYAVKLQAPSSKMILGATCVEEVGHVLP